jgi:hypothetical protein
MGIRHDAKISEEYSFFGRSRQQSMELVLHITSNFPARPKFIGMFS